MTGSPSAAQTQDEAAIEAAIERVRGRDARTIARVATLIEREHPLATAVLNGLYRHTGQAHIIGITGPPGAGKSTLVSEMIAHYRSAGKRVGVVAIDPTSPLSGGATLGDRLRMMRHHADPDVFVRSMANHGQAGGLAPTTAAMVHLLDAAGFDPVIIETVGVGQSDIAITKLAQTTVLVQIPGTGDGVQTLKAGVLELCDVLAVGKADLPGSQQLARDFRTMLSLGVVPEGGWNVPVVLVSATEGTGIDKLTEAIEDHRGYLARSGDAQRRARRRAAFEVSSLVQAAVERATATARMGSETSTLIRAVAARERSPWEAAAAMTARLLHDA